MWRKALNFLLAVALTTFYWSYTRFLFYSHIRRPKLPGTPVIYAHWHGDELLLIGTYIRTRMAIMASRSKDGDLLKLFLGWLGFRVVRGSSTRGGAGGLKGLIDVVVKEKFDASLAVDGPRGPIYKVKPGIIKLAQETQCPLVPGGCAASRRFVFKKAWNRCYLPMPLSKCVTIYGEPIRVPKTTTDEEFEAIRQQLEQTLLALKAEAEALFERKFTPLLQHTCPA